MEKELVRKMINPCCFIDDIIKTGFKINLEIHNNNHSNSILTITPFHPDFGIETRFFNKILKQMVTFYAGLINQYKFKYHIFFQLAFIRFLKKIKDVMKLNYLLNWILIIN